MQRREFLRFSGGAAALAAADGNSPAADGTGARGAFIDVNVTLGDWAVRRSWGPTPGALVRRLAQHGVTEAWTSTFEGVLHSDIALANERLALACAREGGGVLRPFGALNPTLPDWEEDLRRCVEVHGMRGIRLHPNYHGYALDDPRFVRLLELAAGRRVLVQIALSLEDDRSQNPVLVAAPVPAAPLTEALAAVPRARVMLLNATSRVLAGANPLFQRLVAAGVTFDIATLEGVAGIEALFRAQPGARLVFGSHSPYYYFESALLKLEESELTAAQLAGLRQVHASAALESAGSARNGTPP
jgi:predicted TIM-barrel fold metal-dependent hydrolase